MGIFQQFPYSNFHEMNLDQIIKIMREMQDEWLATKAEWASYKDFIDNYFANLNLDDETEKALRALLADGALDPVIDPVIIAETQAWLAEHITQPTTPAIDSSLTIEGAGADAKAVGVQIDSLKWFNSSSDSLPSANKATFTQNGITFSYVANECWHVAGSNTADALYNLFNSTSSFMGKIKPGDIINLFIESGNANIKTELFFYVNGAWVGPAVYSSTAQAVVPANATGMILRLRAVANNVFDHSIFIRVTRTITNSVIGEAIPVILPNTGIDCKNIIEAALNSYGIAYICNGTTLISGVSMPANSRITGAGAGAELKTMSTLQNGIVVSSNCMIDNITLNGGFTTMPTDDTQTACGISAIGTGSTPPFKYNTKISNCIIKGFRQAGIHLQNTGNWSANGTSIVNCEIFFCFRGIWLDQDSEFNKISNCELRNNYMAIANNSGNNIITNCSLTDNTVGVYFQAGYSGHNNGHGSMVGCSICHSGNNTGYAIIMREVNHGFIFSDCNIWYGKILMEDLESVSFNNCVYGGGTPDIDYYNVGALMLNSILFAVTPNIHGSATNVIKTNCYKMDGTPV